MKKLSVLVLLLSGLTVFAQQVPKKVLVAHFTNTRCSVCASRNPGFFNNLDNQNNGDLIHIAYHPSRPYNSCVFYQHNMSGNDDYTQFNQVFGSTPRIVLNGDAVPPSQSYTDPTLFDPYKGQTSPIAVELKQQKFGSDSVRVQIVVRALENNTIGNQKVYVGLAEKEISYNAPNGETSHHNVFRKALWGTTGNAIDIPANQGDSLSYTVTVAGHPEWNMNEIFAYGFVQSESTLEVFQTEALDPNTQDQVSGGISQLVADNVLVGPNPTMNNLQIISDTSAKSTFKIYDMRGELMREGSFEKQVFLNVEHFHRGAYFVVVKTEKGTSYKRILKL